MTTSDIPNPSRRNLVAGGLALASALGLGLLRPAYAQAAARAAVAPGTLPDAAKAVRRSC
jgi:hypothetical protein